MLHPEGQRTHGRSVYTAVYRAEHRAGHPREGNNHIQHRQLLLTHFPSHQLTAIQSLPAKWTSKCRYLRTFHGQTHYVWWRSKGCFRVVNRLSFLLTNEADIFFEESCFVQSPIKLNTFGATHFPYKELHICARLSKHTPVLFLAFKQTKIT